MFPFHRAAGIIKAMVRTLLVLFSIMIFSVSLGHFTSAKAQETGTLSVITTPVRGAIYVDTLFKGTHFWSGDLYVGPHVVSFGDVDGYIAPSPQTVTVIGDQTYYVIGAYRKLFSLLKSVLTSF
jgi:glycine/D-amino acid oxidase-like deaminating enzyme